MASFSQRYLAHGAVQKGFQTSIEATGFPWSRFWLEHMEERAGLHSGFIFPMPFPLYDGVLMWAEKL
jgi:hypothetical protein